MNTVLNDTNERMQQALISLDKKFTNVRAGRANPNMLDGIMVEYYGVPTPLKQIANITIPEARQLSIKPYDRSALASIEKAIFEEKLGNEKVQELINKFNKEIDEKLKEKENELMTI